MKPSAPKVKRKHPVRRALCIALGVLLLYCVLSMAASAVVFRVIFARRDGLSPLRYTYAELKPDCPRTAFAFPSGKNTLSGFRYDAADPKGLIVIVNGIGDGADARLPEIVEFVKAGWSVATWDATGVGESEGDWSVGLQQIRRDLAAFLDYRQKSDERDGLSVVLYGHSAGAYAAATELSAHPEIRAAVCISGFDRPVTLMYGHAKDRVGFLADLEYPFLHLESVLLFGRNANDSARDAISAVSVPVLIVGGDSDDLVPYENSLIRDPERYENPNVRSMLITSAYRSEHSTPWLSAGAARYRAELTDAETADKALANELDPTFLETVLRFYEDALR